MKTLTPFPAARSRGGRFPLIAVLFLAFIASAQAATFTVTNTNDSGAGSLRQAINVAQPDDTITFSDNTNNGAVNFFDGNPHTIALTSSELAINKNLSINGPGANLLTVARSSAAGTPQFRIFFVTNASSVSLSGLTISNGNSNSTGGGIYNYQSRLTINSCAISGNSAVTGGGIYNHGNGSFFPGHGQPEYRSTATRPRAAVVAGSTT